MQVEAADFAQLNLRIQQCCEQYHVKANSCSVQIYFVDDTSETFSSFERFSAFNAGSTSAVESVVLQYEFLVLLPKLQRPQTYSLTVRFASRIAVDQKMRDQMPRAMSKVFRQMVNRTAMVEVKYVDYVVARNLLSTVDQWVSGLSRAATSKLWMGVVDRSDYLPLVARYSVGLAVFALLVTSSGMFLGAEPNLLQVTRFLLCAWVGLFSAYRLAYHLGNAAEESLDRWSALSFVSLTAGDKRIVAAAKADNKRSVAAACFKFVLSLLVSLAAKIIIGLLLMR